MPDGATAIDHALKQVRQRHRIRVGVSLGFHGLSASDIHGRWVGFDVEIARAISVGLFGDADRVDFVPLASADRFDALEAGDIDVGSYNASITYSRESRHDVTFVHPVLFDGEVFATRPENLRGPAEGASVRDVVGTRIGMLAGSTTADNVERYCGRAGIDYTAVLFRTPQEALDGYLSGKTDLYCLDSYLLAGELSGAGEIDRHVFLSDQVSLEAMSPVVRTRDWQLVKAVRWVLYALIEADNLGLTQGNLAEATRSPSRYLGRFLAPDADSVRRLGLVPEFTTRIIEQVGSYADVFDRHLGARSALRQERRANSLRGDGGMLYAPLFI